ncbi:MAG TPA: glucose-6-phosphate dehydrogenase assembly protein OpcA [Pyrinomonadaceae bacterium]|nr:glucose-6-phosphate dehydrogenase assembly protein OpcA [Pyrinomonadaceae bacterium]
MRPNAKQLEISNALDVAAVERVLAELWQNNAGEVTDEAGAMLRARALNFMVFLPAEAELALTHEVIAELTSSHPCRALVMVGEKQKPDRDIEIFVSAFCEASAPTRDLQLCCEEVVLIARGRYVVELASAAAPLLVTDLPVFLWWRDGLLVEDKLFSLLVRATDRLIIDSNKSEDPGAEFSAMVHLFKQTALSDLNWTRLNTWRTSMANFYDVAELRAGLDAVSRVRLDYTAQERHPEGVSPQALLIGGWLASRLDWTLADTQPLKEHNERLVFSFLKGNRQITLELTRVANPGINPGRLVRVELEATGENQAQFDVRRSDDGSHLQTQVRVGAVTHPGRVLPLRNQSMAQLLSSDLEILTRDRVFEDAVRMVVQMMRVGAS